MSKKIRKMILIAIGIFSLIAGGSIWFGYEKPQTVWQDFLSRVGYGRPDTNAPSKIVFLGDSITFREDWNVLFGVTNIANAGVSGNTTDDVLTRLDSVIIAKPQKLFLMIGINDLLRGNDVSHVLINYEKILSEIRSQSPGTEIFVQSVLPVNNDVLTYGTVDSRSIIDINSRLESMTDEKKIFFVDLYPDFCGADNKLYFAYAPDGLHPNAHGYAVWKKIISRYIK